MAMGQSFAAILAQQQANQQPSSPQSAPTAAYQLGSDTGVTPPQQPSYAQPVQNQGQQPSGIPPIPAPPSVTQSQLPPPEFVDNQRSGPLKTLLTRFLYGGGQAMLAHVGLPTDFDLEKTKFQQDFQTAQQEINNQQVTLPNGVTLPLKVAQSVYPALLNAGAKIQSAQIAGDAGIQKQGLANQGKLSVAQLQANLAGGQVSRLVPNQNGAYEAINKYGQSLGEIEGSVVPGLLQRTSSTVDYKQQEDGSYVALPKSTTSGPAIRGRGVAAATGSIPAGFPAGGIVARPVTSPDGSPLMGKAPAQSLAMASMARASLPHVTELQREIEDLDRLGVLGQFKGKMTNALSGKGFSIPGLSDADQQKVGKFINDVKLLDSAMLRTHFGARGGQQMYDKFSEMLNAGEAVPLMKGGLQSFNGYLQGYANMNNSRSTSATPANSTPVSGDFFSQFGGKKH